MKQQEPIERLPGYQVVGMSWKWRLLFTLVFFGPAIYFGIHGAYVLAGLVAVSGVCAFSGFRLGAVAIFTSIAAITAAVAYAPSIGYQQEWRFTEWFGTTGLLNRFISIGAVGIGITLVTTCVVLMMTGRIFRRRPRLDQPNRWLGFLIGGVEGVVATVFLLGGILVLEPIEQKRQKLGQATGRRTTQISDLVLLTAEHAHNSKIGPYIEEYNPFVRFPQLNKIEEVQKSVQVLSDPEKIERLMRHPEVRQLQNRPEVRTAVRKVMDDPEIRTILHSGTPMNRSIAMTLLNHPAILELVDQPGFIDVATKAIRSTKLMRP